MSEPKRHGTLVLSPHFDDAALSIGGSLAAHVFPEPVSIYTVFGVSNYTKNTFHPGCREVTSLRRREDSRYAAALGARSAFADFKEAGLRIGCDFESIFRSPVNTNPCKPARFDRAIEGIVVDRHPRLLLCPAGIGDHWDHFLVCRAILKTKLEVELPVLFYEDLPYAEQVGPMCAKRFVVSLDHRLHSITIPIDWPKKRAGLNYYPSQLGEDDVERVRKYTRDLAKGERAKGPCERLWTAAFEPKLVPTPSG
jgi:LmbE family N-acetylglucosaminyl deacetylase